MSDENKNITRKLMEECWNKGRLDLVDEIMSPRCRFHDPVFPSLTEGAENYKHHVQTCREGFPDLNFKIEDTIAERNEVVQHWSARGKHRGTFLSMPATNKTATVSGTSIYRIENGKIAEAWSDWNLLSLMEQLGLAAPARAEQAYKQERPQPAKAQQAGPSAAQRR